MCARRRPSMAADGLTHIYPGAVAAIVPTECYGAAEIERITLHYHILNTPKRDSGIGALSEAEIARPSTVRVSAGSMTPSSHSRAEE